MIQILTTILIAIGLMACVKESPQKVTTVTKTELPTLVNKDGSYPSKPLEKEVINLTVVQSGVKSLKTFETPAKGIEYNLNHMVELAHKACAMEHKPDILLFHEFPLTGYDPGTRTEKLAFAPGNSRERNPSFGKSG